LLGGAAVDLIFQESHLFLEQQLALKGVAVLGLKLLVGLFELPEGLFGDFQPRRKFGVLIQYMCRARWGRHGVEYTVPATGYNIRSSGRACESQHLMGLGPDVVAIQQPVQLFHRQRHYLLLKQPRPMKPLSSLNLLPPQDEAVPLPP